MRFSSRSLAILTVLLIQFVWCGSQTKGDFVDLSNWFLVEDPADPNLGASKAVNTATLTAGPGAVAVSHDIGYATLNGTTALGSTSGFYFDIADDFEIAVDFDLSFASASGALGLGFGVGEETTGENSAGIGFVTNDGLPFLTFAGAARANDVPELPAFTTLDATLQGSLFVGYEAANGTVSVGANSAPGATAAEQTVMFDGIQNEWNDADLVASFFIRSQSIPLVAETGWEGGNATGVFSNFRVLQGSVTAVPEPSGCLLVVLAFLPMQWRRIRAI